ncbi:MULTISPECIES: hypothetical protein [unclassified Serratia (in: enterobacteria)]|uniref:hypothetical protein n=1 Tax=unclassified Serratia (in: enterobacteria) TaxID=2647522 RepID=UPI00307624F7
MSISINGNIIKVHKGERLMFIGIGLVHINQSAPKMLPTVTVLARLSVASHWLLYFNFQLGQQHFGNMTAEDKGLFSAKNVQQCFSLHSYGNNARSEGRSS